MMVLIKYNVQFQIWPHRAIEVRRHREGNGILMRTIQAVLGQTSRRAQCP